MEVLQGTPLPLLSRGIVIPSKPTKLLGRLQAVQKNGSRAYFYIGSQVLASENIKGRSVDEALREIKEKIQDLVEELKSILGI
jgi:hypothetical protein